MSGVNGIPKCWCLTTVKDVCNVVMGSSPPGESYNSDGNGMPLVNGPVEFGKGPLDKTIIKQYTAVPTKTCKAGDLLLCVRGSTTGRTNVAGFDAAIGRGVAAIRADVVDQSFVNYFFVASRETIYSMGTGSTFPNIRTNQILDFDIPIAPLKEQRRIVAKIEEIFSDLDAGVAALERIRANLKRYRAAVLKAAVEGRLTEEWRTKHPNIEPASKLLERILAERRQKWEEDQLAKSAAANKTPPKGWREKYVEPAGPDTSKLPELPQGWCWATLDAISDLVGGITKDKKRANQPGMREVPYLRVANVQRGFLDLSEMKLIVASNEDIADLQLEIGDVLFTEGGDRDKLGRGWVWSGELPECIHQNHIFRARLLSKEIQPRFVSHHSNTFGQEWFTKAGKQTTNLASINLGILRRFPVPIPPVQEQEKIVAQLDEKLSEIEAAELIIDHSLKRSARLRQSILKRAFEGRLVPQDPTDEPADKLLERIRQQRESGNMKEGKNRSATRRTCGKVKSLPKSERNEPCC